MAVTAQSVYINGTYILKAINSLSANSPETAVATATTIGCMEDGFTLNWQYAGEDMVAQCTGATVMDVAYTGVQKASMETTISEWDSNRTIVESLIWPHGDFGELEEVGQMALYGSDGTPGNKTTILIAEPVTASAAATNTLRWYFYACYPDPDETFSANFNNKMQVVPCVFRCLPVINEDAISAGTSGNRIYYPSDDVSALNLADHTYRFWRRVAAP